MKFFILHLKHKICKFWKLFSYHQAQKIKYKWSLEAFFFPVLHSLRCDFYLFHAHQTFIHIATAVVRSTLLLLHRYTSSERDFVGIKILKGSMHAWNFPTNTLYEIFASKFEISLMLELYASTQSRADKQHSKNMYIAVSFIKETRKFKEKYFHSQTNKHVCNYC